MAVNTIAPSAVHDLMKSGRSLTIIDVRTPAEFAGVHVDGARSLPLDTLEAGALASLSGKGEPIYVVCQSGGRAAKACERLVNAGVGPVYSIEGGTAAWERQGFPVVRGTVRVISIERQVRIAAGGLVLVGGLLAWFVHPGFLVLPLFIGSGLVFAGVTDWCGMGLLLARMPWNRN